MGLSDTEQIEFNTLKRDLLEYHEFGCTHYNPKKERYNELWDKNRQGFEAKIKHFVLIQKQIEQN